ncbi:DUF4239 domain-containing protein [Legionella bononiensis]|uniref:DUF4239 domain-containing protein n=1 Tax=Legionella bononiensis TaxID=2793102 RepID=A0ABS1W8Y0_9GAMM|nr:DUF4239 domain-containing protein [Legionella bononiensis]MBL7479676.1 DUF4239 domain-containing protein [Legionella bononiensis]MBL7525812.1 DUF4239 domain-containing protein [Legionella bononiensis]MBL7561994.1 DUF4239 domain-containing protein [Legionella bononiensis]
MFRELINHIPFGILIILVMALFVVISYVSAYFSDYFFFHENDNTHRQLSNSLMSILTGGFFVLLAFIIINTWNYLQDASNAVSKEADYLAIIMRDIGVFPPETQAKIKAAVGQYTVAVRIDEWAAMRHGEENPEAWASLNNLYLAVQNYNPVTSKEFLFYRLVMNNINNVLLSRRERLNKIDSIIPKSLSYSIFWGSIFLAFMLGVIRGKDSIIKLSPMLLFSALLGFNLALALSFDYPYSGDIAVSNKIFYNGVLNEFSDN